jgi:sugar phosphate isomerase/epimerase
MRNGRGSLVPRRKFLETMAAVAAATRFPNPESLVPSPQSRLSTIGVQLYTLRQAMERDFDGTLARVAQIGFREVEFAGYFNRTPAQVHAAVNRVGLTAPSAHVPIELLTRDWRGVLGAARDMGHRYLCVAWVPEELRGTLDGWKRVADTFNRAAIEAESRGIRFAYHNHAYEFVPLEGRIPFDVLLEATDPTHVWIELDLYWITKGGADPLAYFARYPGRFPLVHVKDSAGAPEHRMVDVGRGSIDWRRIFAWRQRAGIRHFFVEHDDPADPFDSIRQSYEYLRRLEF